MQEYFDFRKISETPNIVIFSRKTKEVEVTCVYFKDMNKIEVSAEGDLSHHLIEDLGIFCNKLREHYGV